MTDRQNRCSSAACDSPGVTLTGKGVVQRIITDLCVMDVTEKGLVLRELADGVTEDDIRAATGPVFTVDLQPVGA